MTRHRMLWFTVLVLTWLSGITIAQAQSNLDQSGTQWVPLEWSVEAANVAGNPFDVIATVTFTHTSGEVRQTEMFYNGGSTWKFRFTGTQPGTWTFVSASSVAALNGLNGTVSIAANNAGSGFVTGYGSKWGWTGTGEVFAPQFVMVGGPQYYHADYGRIQSDIQTFIVEHGFSGFNTPVFCRWFDINQPVCSNTTPADPDFRTFEALEQLIAHVYAQGGVVHIWMWGDDSRDQNPSQFWGLNSAVDQRLQRYIAARLGPLPGWTMGYGFDLFEWVSSGELTAWHDYMHAHMGWDHMLGARSSTNQLDQLSEAMDYSSYEQHRPDYNMYVQTIQERPGKPSFSEDRFRIRDEGREKDYSTDDTRRGLWHSTMAGGVANIWGNLIGAAGANEGDTTSLAYPNKPQIKTYFQFFDNRFLADMSRCNDLTDGYCLKTGSSQQYVFYREDAASIQLNLSGMSGSQPAIAVDTKLPYAEISLGTLAPQNHTWQAPYSSDWAVAVGTFSGVSSPTPTPPQTPIQLHSPAGSVDDSHGHPTYSWSHVDNAGGYELYLARTTNLIGALFYDTISSGTYCDADTCSIDLTALQPWAWLTNDHYSLFINPVPGNVNTWQGPFQFTLNEQQPQAVTPGDVTFGNPLKPTLTWTLPGTAQNSAFYQVYVAPLNDVINPVLFQWFTREELCGGWNGTNCTLTMPQNLSPGTEYRAYVLSWGPGGLSTGGNIGGAADGWIEISFTTVE